MEKRLKIGLTVIGCIFFFCRAGAQTKEGGGVWIEDGGKIVSSLVFSNRAADGFGIAGGNGVVLNCTVTENRETENLKTGWKPGDILCADGSVVDTVAYKSRAVHDAVGVIFWVNSNVYSHQPRAYVVALREEEKKWGTNGMVGTGYAYAVEDTACYTRTAQLVAQGEGMEAAVWCNDFRASGQSGDWKWALPAGYQLAALFVNSEMVNKVLMLLQKYDPAVQLMEKEMYWSSSEVPENGEIAWLMSFSYSEAAFEPGTFLGDNYALRTGVYGVRPVMVY